MYQKVVFPDYFSLSSLFLHFTFTSVFRQSQTIRSSIMQVWVDSQMRRVSTYVSQTPQQSTLALHYAMLYYIILYCTILYYTILYYTILHYTILHYAMLHYIIIYCTILYFAMYICIYLSINQSINVPIFESKSCFFNLKGVMEFDSAIMDYRRRYGAVMSLRDVKTPISVAKSIMGKRTYIIPYFHSMILFLL